MIIEIFKSSYNYKKKKTWLSRRSFFSPSPRQSKKNRLNLFHRLNLFEVIYLCEYIDIYKVRGVVNCESERSKS